MSPVASMSYAVPSWGETPLTKPPTPQQLNQMQTHLDLVLLASESLIPMDADMVLKATLDLEVNTALAEKIKLWSNRDTTAKENPLETFSVEQMRSLVLIICYIAQQHQELIRRAVTLLEQMTAQDKDPTNTTLLGNYFAKFQDYYSTKSDNLASSPTQLVKLASKRLIDLLFYSADHGHSRLWLALLDYSS